jgi:signal transduction histidine kinase
VSLRTRIAVLVVLAFVPAFLVAFISARAEQTRARERNAAETADLVASIANQYDALLSDTRTLLRAIGAIPANPALLTQCDAALEALTRQAPTLQNLVVYRTDGRLGCRARPAPTAVNTDRTEWFRTALDTGSFVGLAADDRADMMVALSLVDSSGAQSVAAAEIAVGELSALVGYARLTDEATVALVDEHDTVFFEVPDPGERVGTDVGESEVVNEIRAQTMPASTVAEGFDGARRVFSAQELSEPAGAVVLAGVPTSAVYKDAAETFRTRVIVLGLATAFAVALALAFAHLSVIRRVRELVAMTRRIGAGDLGARSNVTSSDEIGELGRSLDAMADELHEREIEREQLMSAVVAASEEERKRIAGDVHDDSIQVMSAQVMNLQLLRRRIDDPETAEQIKDLEAAGRAATARLRDLVFELHSPTLDEHGLVAALETLADRAFEGQDVEVAVSSTITEEPPPATSATAYRVAQEALRNARLHSRAEHVDVEVSRVVNDLVMRVADDGGGFDPGTVPEQPGHLGLRGMRERAVAVGGTLTVTSTPGAGTVVTCRLPWFGAGQPESPSTS